MKFLKASRASFQTNIQIGKLVSCYFMCPFLPPLTHSTLWHPFSQGSSSTPTLVLFIKNTISTGWDLLNYSKIDSVLPVSTPTFGNKSNNIVQFGKLYDRAETVKDPENQEVGDLGEGNKPGGGRWGEAKPDHRSVTSLRSTNISSISQLPHVKQPKGQSRKWVPCDLIQNGFGVLT